jgi:hypothetical protein
MSRNSPGAVRRVTRLRQVLRGPREVLLAARMVGWATALPILKRRLPLARLVEAAAQRRPPASASASIETVITVARWIYRLPAFRDNCLERSLLTYRYLPESASRYQLVLGVRRGDEGPPGHAWLTVDGVPVHDSPQSLADLVPILVFDAAGQREAELEGARTASRAPESEERGTEPNEEPHGPPRAG